MEELVVKRVDIFPVLVLREDTDNFTNSLYYMSSRLVYLELYKINKKGY